MTRVVDGHPQPGSFVPPYAYEMYLRGELMLQAGRPERAAAAFEQALAAPELDPYVVSRLGYALGLSGQEKASNARLEEAERLSPCLVELWLTRGRLAHRAGDGEAALSAFERAVECDPNDAEAERARLELAGGTRTDAPAAKLEDAGVIEPREVRVIALRDAVDAGDLERVQVLLAREPQADALPWPLVARAHGTLGETEMAARAWLQAAPLASSDLVDASLSFLRAGYWKEARAAAETALIEPLDSAKQQEMQRVVAGSLWGEGRGAEAVTALPEGADARTLAAWLEGQGLAELARSLRAAPRTQARQRARNQ